jgi:NAD+ diphosphatase
LSVLPESYQSPLHLPFNRACLEPRFHLAPPAKDPGGEGCVVLLHGSNLLVAPRPTGFELPEMQAPAGALYLGQWDGRPCRLARLSRSEPVPEGLEPCGLTDERPRLPIELLSLGGLARTILHWQQRSSFCGCCGAQNDWLAGEWGRGCPACGAQAYPAIHPCAIVLIRRPGEVLLTRKASWAEGRYSLVAGFQEFGEALEETAIREAREETGVTIAGVRYVGSQCWPFPSQVMVGFVADYVRGELAVDREELADARWFAVDDLPLLPPKRSIARYILDHALGLP